MSILKISFQGIDYFCEWCNIMDAPRTYFMSLKEFKKYYRQEYGRSGMKDFPERMDRVEKYGTSIIDISMQRTIIANRAGPKGGWLSYSKLIKQYLIERPTNKNKKQKKATP